MPVVADEPYQRLCVIAAEEPYQTTFPILAKARTVTILILAKTKLEWSSGKGRLLHQHLVKIVS